MTKFSKILLVVCLLLFTALVLIVVKEDYPRRLIEKIHPSPVDNINMWLDSEEYSEYGIRLSSISNKLSVVLLGDSQTFNGNWNQLLARDDLFNAGIRGDITSAMKTRVNGIIKLSPRICFVQGGVNDINLRIPEDTIIRNLSIMVDSLKANHIIVVLNTVAYTSSTYHNPINDKISELNKKIIALVQQKDIDVIDINAVVSDDNHMLNSYVRHDDGLHYSYRCYLIWRDLINGILKLHGV